MDQPISAAALEALAAPLLGLEVSHAWHGFGSAVFVEFGAAGIDIEWDWRIEAGGRVLVGSSSSKAEIDAGIRALIGIRVRSIAILQPIPDLEVRFADGPRLRTLVMRDDQPRWRIRLPDGRYGYARADGLYVGHGGEPLTPEEKATLERIEAAVARWGKPRVEPALGACRDCAFFVPLEGTGAFLDYGCCAGKGSLGGRVVHRRSGCPAFQRDE